MRVWYKIRLLGLMMLVIVLVGLLKFRHDQREEMKLQATGGGSVPLQIQVPHIKVHRPLMSGSTKHGGDETQMKKIYNGAKTILTETNVTAKTLTDKNAIFEPFLKHDAIVFEDTKHENINNYSSENHTKTNKSLDIFAERWKHVVDKCTEEGRKPPTHLENSKLSPKMILELPHNILYCPVQKVASTFWTKTLTAMNSMGYITSPYDTRGKQFKAKTYSQHVRHNPEINMEQFTKHATSLLVVRDPYTKLFSAYVDKLFQPNIIFWNYIGKKTERFIKPRSEGNISFVCGNKVSFADYVKFLIYVNQNNKSIDGHFTSITSHCDPCVTKYDFISKLETLKEDFHAIIGEWNKTHNLDIKFEDFDKDSALSIAKVHINLSLYTRKHVKYTCSIPSHMYLFRTWRFLQISGIIPKNSKFPTSWYTQSFKERPVHLMTEVVNVLQSNITWALVKRQRKEAMLQAYSAVSIEDMFKLREIVKTDCKYFGYNDMPDELFKRTTSTLSFDFDYFDAVK